MFDHSTNLPDDDAGTTVSRRRLRRHDGLPRSGQRFLIGDRELLQPQNPKPGIPNLVQAVIRMPLVFRLHQRGAPVSRIAIVTGLSPSKVRTWITRYGTFAGAILACCRVNLDPDNEAEGSDD
jgi:hypothetical protein